MPVITETTIDAWANCNDARCGGHRQQPVQAVRTVVEYTFIDLGGDLPGVERSATQLRFADVTDAQCPVCGEPRMVADQVRPIYANVSGQPQDALLAVGRQSERVQSLELEAAKRDAAMAQMQATLERQTTLIDRLLSGQAVDNAPRARARKETTE